MGYMVDKVLSKYMVHAHAILIFVCVEHFILIRCSPLRTYGLTKRVPKTHQQSPNINLHVF